MKKLYLVNKEDQFSRRFVAAYDIQDAINTYRIEIGYEQDIDSIELFTYGEEIIEVII